MNEIWSKYVQGIQTLYCSRKIQFSDYFAKQYQELFAFDADAPLKILEIGCGPGALAGALHRWYPNASITAIDRDSAFIAFAKEHEKDIDFVEADIAHLPFDDNTFDITISNTVSEHVEPSVFYGEQHRVLKSDGKIIVLSNRRTIASQADCLKESDYEQAFWEKAKRFDQIENQYHIGEYAQDEAQLPLTMAQYGFGQLQRNYLLHDLSADIYPKEMALAIINSQRACELDAVDSTLVSLSEYFTEDEGIQMKALINQKYDQRVKEYEQKNQLWDTQVKISMVLIGKKL